MAGLRERKKQATRVAIRDAAMRLFDEQGFTATTIDQIATAAEVSRATVLNYFATKEDIVFGDAPAAMEHLRATLEERPADQGTIEAFRVWLLALAELGGWIEPELVLQHRLAAEAPVVAARQLALHQGMERIIAAALVAELGPAHTMAAELAGASLLAGVRVAEETATERMRESAHALQQPEIDQLLGNAVTFAEAGIAGLTARSR